MKFPEWLPDRDDFENPGLVECLNVIPDTYYKPVKDLVSTGSAMTSYARGGFGIKGENNDVFNFVGDETDLYRLVANSLTSVNTGYTTALDELWSFAEFGTYALATNFGNNIQKFNVATDTVFTDLGGSPPKCKHLDVVGDFLVLANIDGASNRIQWSGINDIEEWTAGTAESGSQDLAEGGSIRGFVGGEYGLIFQDNHITRMNYQGPPLNFSFDVIEQGRGAISSGSIIQFGIFTYFISYNGFYVSDGTQSQPISTEKVDTYFFDKLNETLSHKISVVADPVDKTITWSYVGDDATDGLPNWLIIYNWELQRWSEASINHEIIFNGLSTGLTLEELDTLFPDLDTMTVPLDSRVFKGGSDNTFAINTDHKIATFTGAALAGKIKTGEYELVQGDKSIITEIWPLIDGTITVTVESRSNYQETATPTGAIAVNTLGFAPFTENGRYHSVQFDFTDWTRANGYKIRSESSGGY